MVQKEQLSTNLRESQKRENTPEGGSTFHSTIAEAPKEAARGKGEMDLAKNERPKWLAESATENVETFHTGH